MKDKKKRQCLDNETAVRNRNTDRWAGLKKFNFLIGEHSKYTQRFGGQRANSLPFYNIR